MVRRYKPWELPPLLNESREALHARRNIAYFEWQVGSVQEFWRRIGREINFKNTNVLDLGCGHGTLCVDLAKRGALNVIGLDLDDERIAFAKNFVPKNYPELTEKISFVCQDIRTYPLDDFDESFDFIISKDAFEHIMDLEDVVDHARRLLKPGGQLVIGTSPLYFSPFGDHGRYFGRRLPWAAAIPEPLLFTLASWRQGTSIQTAGDVGLNKMTPRTFRNLFPSQNWRISSIKYNASNNILMSFLDLARKWTPLERYCTVSLYAVVAKIS
jgi:SAM-dependent methyltransferase